MTPLDPGRVFATVSGVRCPECGEPCTREPLPNRSAGVEAVRVVCGSIDCGFAASFERDADGQCRRIDDAMKTASDAADAGKLSSREALRLSERNNIARPRCRVHKCGCHADEGGLCSGHRALWLNAEKPDVAAWAAAINPSPRTERNRMPREPANVICQVPGCKKSARGKFCASHQYRYIHCGKPDVAAWLTAGAPTPTKWNAAGHGGGQTPQTPEAPEAPAPKARSQRSTKGPTSAAPSPTAGLDKLAKSMGLPAPGPQLVEFGQPVDAVLVGLIGQHVTIADRQGLVLHQFPLAG